jgi:hypothetical protein
MNDLIKDIAGFLLPPFRSLSLPREHRAAPLAQRLAGQKVLTLNISPTSVTAGVLIFSRRGVQFTALGSEPASEGRLSSAVLTKLKGASKARYVALAYGASPESTEVALVPNTRSFQSDEAFHTALAHNVELFIQKAKAGYVYRGFPHREYPIAIVGTFDPTREAEDLKLCESVGLMVVRAQSNLLALANVGLAHPQVVAGAPLLIIDQGQCLFITSSPKGQWEHVRCRKLKDGAPDFARFITEVIKPGIKATNLVVLDTHSSGDIELDTALAGLPVTLIAINGVEPNHIPNCVLSAA